MKRILTFVFVLLLCFLLVYLFLPTKDIRNDFLREGITKEKINHGKDLLLKMEKAYGGRSNWEKYKQGEFIQEADWYGKLKMSHWDTVPQRFSFIADLGTNHAEMKLLNGKNSGTKFKVDDNGFWKQIVNNGWTKIERDRFYNKIMFKNYWFQFPFRISEASIISYAGEEEVNGEKYDLLFATWGTESANKEFDQFVLYLDKKNHRIDYLYFTVREALKSIALTAQFKNFKKVNKLILPFDQYVKQGKPNDGGMKMHENHYIKIELK